MKNLIFSALALTLIQSCKLMEAAPLFLAKNMCSCLFLTENPLDYCEKSSADGLMMARYEVDEEKKEVRSWMLAGPDKRLTIAKFENKKFGCTILSIDPPTKMNSDSFF